MRKHGAAERVFSRLPKERVSQALQWADKDLELQNAILEYMAFEAYMVRGWSHQALLDRGGRLGYLAAAALVIFHFLCPHSPAPPA